VSDFARLKDKLTKLRQRERVAGEGRRLKGTSPETFLSSLVMEVSETVLPRRLSFAVEGGKTLHIVAAQRKLQAVASPLPEGTSAGNLADQPLSDEQAPEVGALRALILEAFQGAETIAIQSARPSAEFSSDVGIPANILARSWELEAVAAGSLDADAMIAQFIEGMGDEAEAWLRIEGEDVTDQRGAANTLDALGEHAAVFLDGYFGKFEALFPGEGGACATGVGPMGDSGLAAFFVEAGEVSVFVAVKAGSLPEIAKRWQKLALG